MNNEDIKILEEKIKIIESLCTDDYINKSTVIDPLKYALENLIAGYKQQLEENEILKQEKEQAWEEWNNLEQGSYETEQKLKQQIKELRKENEELNYKLHSKKIALEIYNRYIPKSKVKEKIKELKEAYEDSKDENGESQYYYPDYTIRVLEELLEKRK